MKILHMVAVMLLIIGGLNWLLVGAIGWDIGTLFGGQGMMISRIIYTLVGLSALFEIFTHKQTCKLCAVSGTPNM